MTTGIVHTTAADGTFSATGATAWDAAHNINETGGASLGIGAIADGQFLKRSGTNIISANPGSNSGPVFPGLIPLTGVSYPACDGHGLNTGDNDLYTVPSGKRALLGNAAVYNSSAGNIAWYPEIKVSGSYYRLLSTTTTGTLAVATSVGIGYIAEAGETIAVNTATNNGLNIWISLIVFDNTITAYSAKLLSLANGDNTLYTCPANTTAFLLGATGNTPNNPPSLQYVNDSGGTRAVSTNNVPSGGSVATSNLVSPSGNANNNTKTTVICGGHLDAGDFINLNTNAATATQWAWINVMEIT